MTISEDDGLGHGHLGPDFSSSSQPTGYRRILVWKESRLLLSQVAMVILLFSLGIGRADLLFSRRYAMTTSTALY
jgi:hypothetical protein